MSKQNAISQKIRRISTFIEKVTFHQTHARRGHSQAYCAAVTNHATINHALKIVLFFFLLSRQPAMCDGLVVSGFISSI